MSKERWFAASLLAASFVYAAASSVGTVKAAAASALDHLFLIVMENHSYDEIIGNSNAPYINSLLGWGALASSYYAVAHPSLPNYLSLVGGSTFGITSDCTRCWIEAPNIGDSLDNARKTWKAYEEAMPTACFVGDAYPYVQKHDPLVYFNDIRTNATRCQSHVVPYAQLTADLTSASTTPNMHSSRRTDVMTCMTAPSARATAGSASRFLTS